MMNANQIVEYLSSITSCSETINIVKRAFDLSDYTTPTRYQIEKVLFYYEDNKSEMEKASITTPVSKLLAGFITEQNGFAY